MKSNIIIVALFLTLISCKDNQKGDVIETKKNQYKITLNAIIKKDDTFQIYYKESNDDNAPFEEKNSVRVDFKGSEIAQDIIFNLPEDVYPTYLRVDFGSNKDQSEIIVNQFKIDFLDKEFSINGKQFFDYFIAEKAFIKFDKETSKAIPFVTIEGNYDPMFFSEATFNEEMIKLSK